VLLGELISRTGPNGVPMRPQDEIVTAPNLALAAGEPTVGPMESQCAWQFGS
jgi:hypothetical protein